MISVQNHPLQLSGNKYWLIICIAFLFSACSPKIRKPANKKPDGQGKEKEVEKPVERFTQANISLLIPFRLNEINLKTATKAGVDKAAMAIDFYQGFKLGIDSAASLGLNFNLNVYDTRDTNAQIDGLLSKGTLTYSNLLVGPVFPQGIKHITPYSIARNIPVISPLAATHPKEFNNPNLISVVNNIDLHAAKIVNYVAKNYSPENTIVVLINPKSTSDEVVAAPLREYFKVNNKAFVLQEYPSVYSLETKMQKDKKYVLIVTSADRKFVVPTLDRLMKIKSKGFDLNLFGHPDWIKQNYNVDKLQALNTSITASYHVNYHSPATLQFIKKYRAAYRFEPSEYSFKGFDIGFYFGKLFAEHGADYLKYLTREKYEGLHNTFDFYHDEKLGYINTSLMLLRYKNFAINIVE
ncbi:amino acid ABC transporter substrate-binding protein [Pedobacter sp. PLR]|uniref:amino acid ABC transporter substrate-binding protein n=1 Tax=Pedobacter sp. PLR TaxID=2994465 RepID=UPI00224543A1|nr:amino acid ABC transporter substrate-binding protein [Pedobacter sp. PLR]MCX2450965.1 amino acid ABC transporter substrate-binding protein [Pedobacter sp. PLR]